MIETTYEDGGKVGVIVPHGVLFREERRCHKKKLIEDNLGCRIGLPSNRYRYPCRNTSFQSWQRIKYFIQDASREFVRCR